MPSNRSDEFAKRVEASEFGVELTCTLYRVVRTHPPNRFRHIHCGSAETPWPGVTDMFSDDSRYIDRALPTFYETVELAIQAVDSSYWLVFVRDAELGSDSGGVR